MAERGSIVMDIRARVSGYEQSLRKLQAEFAKVDPGSQIGKSLSRAIQTAETQLKALSKNLTPRVTSDSQIDNITDKVNTLGETIQSISVKMRQVDVGDLNLSVLGKEFETLQQQIVALENELTGKFNQGIQEAVAASSQLQDVFTNILKVDPSKMTVDQMFTALQDGAKKTSKEVDAAQASLNKIQKSINTQQNTVKSKSEGLFGSYQSRDQLLKQARDFQQQYEAIFENVKGYIRKGFERLSTAIPKEEQDELIEQFFKGLTPENLKTKLEALFNRVAADGSIKNIPSRFFTKFFHGSINQTDAERFFDFGAVDTIKAKFREFVESIGPEIGGNNKSFLLELIDKNRIKDATATTMDDINAAYSKVQNTIQKALNEIDRLMKEKTTTQGEFDTAQAARNAVIQVDAQLRQMVENVSAENKDLKKQLDEVKQQLLAEKQAAADRIQQTGREEGLNSQEISLGTEEVQKYKSELEQVHEKEQLVGRIEGVVQRWFSIYAAVRMVGQAIRSVISTLKELDATITEIAIVTNMTQKDLWNQMSDYTAMAQKYAASISGVYKVSQLYYQQGLQTKEVMELTEQTLKMARISGLDYAEATDYMTNAVRSFKMEMNDAQRVVDVYSAIAAKSATNVTELAEAMSKTASSAESVGSSFENTTAMMAVMIEATRESATNIGSAMKSIISRYGEMKADPSKLVDSEGEEMSLNKVDKALQSVGISIQDINHQFRDFDEVIMELAEKWDTIDKNTQRYIATVMAGNRQQSRFLALVSSYDRLKELSAEAANSEDAAQLQYLKTLDSIDAKTQQLQTSLQNLYVDSGLEEFYKFLIDASKSIVDTFNNMPKLFDLPILAIGKFGAAFWGIARIVTVVAKYIKTELLMQSKVIENQITLTTQQEVLKRLQLRQQEMEEDILDAHNAGENYNKLELERTAIVEEQSRIRAKLREEEATREVLTNNVKNSSKLFGKGGSLFGWETGDKGIMSAKAKGLGWTIGGLALSSLGSTLTSNNNKGSFGAIAGSLASTAGTAMTGFSIAGIPGAIIGGLIGAWQNWSNVFVSNQEKIKQLQEEAEEAKNTYIQKKSDTQNLTTQIEQLRKLEKARYDSKEAEEEYYQVANQMAETYPGLIKSMDEAGNVVIDLNAAEIQLINTRQESIKAAKDAAKKAAKSADEDEQESKKKQGASGNLYLQISRQMGANSLYTPDFLYGNYKAYQRIQKENTTFSSLNEQQEYFKKQYLQQSSSVTYDKGGSFRSSESINLEDWKNFIQYMIENPDAIYTGTNTAINSSTLINEAGKYVQNEVNAQYKSDISAQVKRSGIATTASTYFQGITDNFLSEIPNIMSIITTQAEIQMKKDSYGENEITTEEYDKFIDEDLEGYLAEYQRKWNEFWNKTLDTQGKKDAFVEVLKQTSILSKQQFSGYLKDTGLSPEMQASIIEDAYKNAYNIEDFTKRYTPETTGKETQIQQAMLDAANGWISNLGSSELQSINEFYDNLNALTISEKIDVAKQPDILNKYLSIGEALNSADNTIREQLEAVWYNWDGTLTGLYEVQEKLAELGFEDDDNLIGKFIETVPYTLSTELSTFASSLTSKMEDFEKALSKASKGMDVKEATEMANKLNVSIDTFDFKQGKFFFDDVESIQKAYIDYNIKLFEQLERAYQNEINELDPTNSEDAKKIIELQKQMAEIQVLADKYIPYQTNVIRIQNGELYDVLLEATSNNAVEAHKLMNEALKGDFSSFITGEYASSLEQYVSAIKESLQDITKNVANAAIESIKTGKAVVIKEIETTSQLFIELNKAGFTQYFDEAGNAYISIAKENIDQYVEIISKLNITDLEKADYIKQGWDAAYSNNLVEAATTFTNSTIVTREAAQNLILALGKDIEAVDEIMLSWGYYLNGATGQYEFFGGSLEELQKELDSNTYLSIEQRNQIEAQIAKLTNELSRNRSSAMKDIISNYKSVTEEQIKALGNAYGIDFNYLTDKAFTLDNTTGTYKTNLDFIQNIINHAEGAEKAFFEELYAGIADNYLDELSTAVNYATQGTTKQADMQKFINNYKEVVGKEINLGEAFNWNDTLQAFVLDSEILKEYLEKQKDEIKEQFGTDAAKRYLESQFKQYQNAINISGYLSSERTNNNRKQLEEQIKAAFILQNKEYDDRLIDRIEKGGLDAVEALREVKPEASSEEIQNVYRAIVDDQLNALETIGSLTAGQIIATNGALYDALSKLGMVDNNGVINETFNMVAAYTKIYENMKDTAGKTQLDLNKAYADVLTAGEQQEINAIEAMSNAMGMTYYQLGEILGKQGKDLEDFMKNRAASLGIEQIGNGKIRLNNFNAFAQEMNWEYGSEEYLSAFKAYNDSLVELNRQTEKSILEEVKNVISANRGDKVNLTYLINTLGAGAEQILNEQLKEYGASIKNGILTISESADLIGISQTIQDAAENSGKLMEEELAEIADSITEAINNYSELLIKGITGNLTNVDLQKLMKDSGLQSVTYEKTADGLRLTQEYLIRLYSAMDAGVNKIKVFDELNKYLQENNENYKTASANLARINELNKLRIEEAKKLQDTSDAISKADRQISQNRLKQYSQELAVAEKIAAIRATTEDSSYSFMDQNMPGGFQNPINYWESWGKAMKSIQETGENGYIGIQDYYNMITHIQDLAVQTGKDMKFMGMTISQDGTSAAELIEKGFKAMTLDVESGNTVLSLDKLSAELGEAGFDFKAGAEGFDENIQDGIHEFAKSQVKMLDGMIKFVETIAAMEKLGDLDIEGNGIDFNDIFSQPFYEPGKGAIWNYTEQYQKVAQDLLNSGKDLEGIKVGAYTLKEILKDTEDGIKDITIENDTLVTLLQALYSTSISENYNEKDIYNSILETFQINGISGELSIGQQKVYIDSSSGIILEFSDENNHWLYNGKDLGSDPQKALEQALAMRTEELENLGVEVPEAIKVEDKAVEQPIHNTFVLSVSQVDAYAKDANVNFVEKPENPGSISELEATTPQANITKIGAVSWDSKGTIDNKNLGIITSADIVGALNKLGINNINQLTWATGVTVPTGFNGNAPLTANNVLAVLSALGINDVKTLSWQLGNTITGTFDTALPTTMQAVLQSLGISDVENIAPTQQFLDILTALKILELNTILNGKASGAEVDVDSENINTDNAKNTIQNNTGNITLPEAIATFASLIVEIASTSGAINTSTVSDALNRYKDTLGTPAENGALEALFAALEIGIGDSAEPQSIGKLQQFLNNASLPEQQLLINFATMLLGWTGKIYSGNGDPLAGGAGTGDVTQDTSLINAINHISTLDDKQLSVFFATILAAVKTDKAIWGNGEEDKYHTALQALGFTNEEIDALITAINVEIGDKDSEGNDKQIVNNATTIQDNLHNILTKALELPEEAIQATIEYIKASTTNARLSDTSDKAEDLRNKVINLLNGADGSISIGTIDAIITGYNLTVDDEPNSNDKKYYDEKGIFKNILFEEDTELWQNNKAAWNKYLNDTFSTGNIDSLSLVITAIGSLTGENVISDDGQFEFGSQKGKATLAKLGLSWQDGKLTTTFNDSQVIDLGTKEGHVKLSQIQIDNAQPITTELDEEAQVVTIDFVGKDGKPYTVKVPAAAFIDQVDGDCVDSQGRLTKLENLSVDILTFLSDLQKGAWDAWRENNIPNEVPVKITLSDDIPQDQWTTELNRYGQQGFYYGRYSNAALGSAFNSSLITADNPNEFFNDIGLDENNWRDFANLAYSFGIIKDFPEYFEGFKAQLESIFIDQNPDSDLAQEQEKWSSESNVGEQTKAISNKDYDEAYWDKFETALSVFNGEGENQENIFGAINAANLEIEQFIELLEEAISAGKVISNDATIATIIEKLENNGYTITPTINSSEIEFNSNEVYQNVEEQLEDPLMIGLDVDPTNAVKTAHETAKEITDNISATITINGSTNVTTGTVSAKGNIALSKGTLMGELGPELYVTNGRYFVAGQNGAEFVNLPKDAIVFNHLQTQKLLNNGSSSRGKPVTNEKSAVSYAKGTGPAMASASSVLATLKQLRAQWQAIADMSVADLAGKGGGGGGGGQEDLPGFIRDVERWYNWLQKIADLEKQINYEETLRSKIQSDMVSNGKAYYASQKRQLDQLRDSTTTSSSLYLSQLDYFNQRREQLNNNSPLSELYTFDTTGQLHYQPGSYQWLAQLFKTNDYGQLELTPQQQYEMIMKRNPQFAQYMKYNSEGKEIKASDYEDQAQYYLDMVKAFSDRMDSEKEEMQSLFDSINEQGNAVNEKLQKQNELIQAMRDNQKEVEESVLDAIVESREREIKEIQDTKDALQKSNEDFINGLSNQLEKERKLYDNNQNDEELNRNRRQLAILQRSGGSAAQIASLQKQIEEQSRDQYFEKQQEQIDAVKEASDLQIERLDRQIELMNETLEYQKANGLLWNQVYEVMAGTPQQISDFIMQNTAAEWAKSPLSSTEAANNWIFKTEQWVSFRDDIEGIYDALTATWNMFDKEMENLFGVDIWSGANKDAIKDIFNAKYIETGDYNEAAKAVQQSSIYQSLKKQQADNTKPISTQTSNQTATNSGGMQSMFKVGYHFQTYDDRGIPLHPIEDPSWYGTGATAKDANMVAKYFAERRAKAMGLEHFDIFYDKATKVYKNGGLINYTGPAWVDGSKQRPESIWDADTTKLMRDNLLNSRNLNLLGTFWDTLQNYQTAINHSYSNNSESLIIENAVVNMNVASIANDYDARRAGEQAMEEMLKIARKTKVSSFS